MLHGEQYGAFHHKFGWFFSVFPSLSDDSNNNNFMINNETHFIAKQNFYSHTNKRRQASLSLSLPLPVQEAEIQRTQQPTICSVNVIWKQILRSRDGVRQGDVMLQPSALHTPSTFDNLLLPLRRHRMTNKS